LDLPNVKSEPKSYFLTKLDGRNALVAFREFDSDYVHLAFYFIAGMDDAARWVRTDYFIEKYGEWNQRNKDELHDFHVALSGETAFLGFPLKNTTGGGAGAGVVYV